MRKLAFLVVMVGFCSISGSDRSSTVRLPQGDVARPEAVVLREIGEGPVMLLGALLHIDVKEENESKNEAFIQTTGEHYMYADEGERIDVRFDTPYAKGPLVWAAKGLPRGLSISASTGLISGRVSYDQAGSHPVVLTATSARGDTYSVKFSWKVSDTQRLDWIDDQFHRVGEKVRIPFRTHDEIGNPLSFTFVGLPPGVRFDERFGFVGRIEDGADGHYETKAYVNGGNATDCRTFSWKVYSEERVVAVFAINDTFVHSDDVGLVGSQQNVLVKYFLAGSERGPIKIEVTSGAAAVTMKKGDRVGSKSVVYQISDWPIGWLRVYLIAKAPSTANDDIVVAAFRWSAGKWVKMK